MKIYYQTTLPKQEAFYDLFETTGWNKRLNFTSAALFTAINQSWYMVSAYDEDKLVGFGRVISDGVYQTFIGDMIVHPEYQNRKIGTHIMTMLLEKCQSSGLKWVQLSCAKGKQGFYKKFGFEERPKDAPGMQKYQ